MTNDQQTGIGAILDNLRNTLTRGAPDFSVPARKELRRELVHQAEELLKEVKGLAP